ncbi:hypothetical protein BY458DRAFT_448138, partial [Sporodiniella umbellata]
LVSYTCKSPKDNVFDNKTQLVQLIIGSLKEHSFASRIYISMSSWASIPFAKRDTKPNNEIMSKLQNINCNTQDLLKYVNTCDHDICLISVDFAVLTTRSDDLVKLIEENPAIKKIAIETFITSNKFFIFEAQNLKKCLTDLTIEVHLLTGQNK